MKIPLAYGTSGLETDFPDRWTTLIEPTPQPGLPDERAALRAALDAPIGAAPLRSQLAAALDGTGAVCVVFTDITRATPNERLIPWLLEYFADAGLPRERVTLLNALGTHRPNTREELCRLLTPEVVDAYRVLNHEPENPAALAPLGVTSTGVPALLNRHLVEAQVRVVTGFIEPHFFAGFSGGPKGIMPGVAGLETVISNHGRRQIDSPNAAFGVTESNPVWEEMRDIALRPGPSFLINVTLNEARRITGVFAGDLLAAHREGIEWVRRSAMQAVAEPFDIVVTTNSGYPLDQNVYQAVKGMSAAARIVRRGGAIIIAAECREGVPGGSPFDLLLRRARTPEDVLTLIEESTYPEQWQAQIQSIIQRKADVYLYSSLPEETVRATHLRPCADIAATVARLREHYGPESRVAVLPQGPLTVPYLTGIAS